MKTKYKAGQIVEVNRYAVFITLDAYRFAGQIGVIKEVIILETRNPGVFYEVLFLSGEKRTGVLCGSELMIPDPIMKLTKLDKIIYDVE